MRMWPIQTALLLIGLISYIDAQPLGANVVFQSGDNTVTGLAGWMPYDCRRAPGLPCSGTGVCVEGVCVSCRLGFTGYDCSVNVGLVPAACTGATSPCVNGECYINSTGAEVCLCNPIFTGANCDTSRASVQCRAGDMVVRIYPQGSTRQFQGGYAVQQMGMSSVSADPGCSGTTSTSRFVDGQYFETPLLETLNTSNPCSSYLSVTPVGGTTGAQNICYDIRLMYTAGLTLATDDVFKFCCRDIANTGSIIDVDNGPSGGGANVGGSISIINSRLAFTAPPSATINPGDTVTVGQDISFVMSLDGANNRYADFRVVTCRAFPGNLTIVSNQCPDSSALSVIRGIRQSGVEIWVDIKAYKGATSSSVLLECDCKVCETTCTPPIQCSGFLSQNYGRKKRQVNERSDDTSAETFTTRATFIVLDSSMASTKTPSPSSQPCYQSTVFIAIAAVFGVLILVALVVSIVVCVRYAARGGRSDSPPAAYFNAGMAKA